MDGGKAVGVVYHGNCHCGRYRFTLSLPNKITESRVIECTCSLCAKKGYMWVKPPPNGFTVVRNDGCITKYQSAALQDNFCQHCGTGIMGAHVNGPLHGICLVNIRALQGVNPFEIESYTQEFVTPDEYKQPADISTESTIEQTGSCHCGKVRCELLAPITSLQLKEDNCSSCVRNGHIGAYPQKSQVVIHGRENTFEYLYGRKYTGTAHCKTCGVTVFSNVYGPPLSVFDSVPAERKEAVMARYWESMALQPVNVRALNGVNLKTLRLTIVRSDEGTEGYALD